MKAGKQKALVGTVILLLAAGVTGTFVFGQQPLQERDMAAYNSGHYAEALPLFKKWAQMPGVYNDPTQLKQILSYIMYMQAQLNPNPTATGPAAAIAAAARNANPSGAPATAPSQQDLLQQALAFTMQTPAGNPGDPPMTKDTRIPHTAIPVGIVKEMSIKEMGNFDFDPTKDADIPADVKLLDGAKVRLTGFMWPLTQSDKITEFALVPSLTSCCFGAPPGVQHVITCHVPGGKSADFSVDQIDVEGTVHVRVKREDNYTSSIFELDVTSVRPKAQ